MSGRMHWKSLRGGYILLESVIVLFLMTLALFALFPVYGNWQKERQLETGAEEIAAALRQGEIQAKSESSDYPRESAGLVFYCLAEGNKRVHYYTKKGRYKVAPRGYLPEGIILTSGTASLGFRKDGPVRSGSSYRIELKTADDKYRRIITVAAYTGRVRIEKQ